MGLIFKKTIRLGLFNINLSKSGISTSVGVRGFRMNSKGHYRAGTGNLYYQGRWKDNSKSNMECTSEENKKSDWKAMFWIILVVILLGMFLR